MFRWPLFFLLVGGGAVVIAAATLGISLNSSSLGVHSGATMTATGPVTSTTICNASTGSYGHNVTIAWGNVTTGSKVQEYICVQNTGTGTSNPIALSDTLPPNYGSITSPQQGATVAANSFLLVEIDWNVAPTAPTGSPGPTFTVSI
jgi:hypothetical protein